MKFLANIIKSLVGLSLISSCAHMFESHARVVKKQPGMGGVVAILQGADGGSNARMEANSFMNQNCRGQFEIIEEGEVVVGQQGSQRTNAHNDRDIFNRKTINSNTYSHTSNVTEWRITYKCKKTATL